MNRIEQTAQPKLGLWDAIAIILGIIVGAGIYETPGGVFRMLGDPWLALGIWLLCGMLALVGALCYAELAAMKAQMLPGNNTPKLPSGEPPAS